LVDVHAWDEGLSAEGSVQAGVVRVRIRNDSAHAQGDYGGVWVQRDPGFDATSYRRLGIELRVNKGIEHRVEIRAETPDAKKPQSVNLALSKLGREGEWLKVGVDLEGSDPRLRERVGRVVFMTTSADLPRGEEIEMDIRRIVFLR
jgi:hypothetical protein